MPKYWILELKKVAKLYKIIQEIKKPIKKKLRIKFLIKEKGWMKIIQESMKGKKK